MSDSARRAPRILHTADVHLGRFAFGRPVGSALDRFVEVAEEQKPDLAVIAGDLFDNRRPGPSEILHAVRALRRLTALACPVVIAPGNHDGMGTIADPDTHTLAWLRQVSIPDVIVFTQPSAATILRKDGPIRVVGVPFPHKRAYDSVMPEAEIRDRIARLSADVTDAIRQLVDKARREWPDDPLIFTGHFSVVGAMLGTEHQMHLGWDTMIDVEALGAVDYAALGHIHRQQQVAKNAWYAGSPEYLGFGEADDPKGFLLVEDWKVRVIPTGLQPAIVIEAEGIAALDEWLAANQLPERFDVHVKWTAKERRLTATDVADLRKRLMDAGASYTKIDVVEPERERRARAEIDADTDVEGALRKWAASRDVKDVDALLGAGRELIASFGGET